MPTPLFTRLLLSLGLLLSLAPSAAPAQTPGDAPAISGRTLSAEPFDLATLRGKVVLVLFWSTDCPVCLDKMPELRANAQGWRGKPFELVSVSFDRRERDAADYEKLVGTLVPTTQRFQTLWAGHPAFKSSAVRPAHLPTTWLIDKAGKLVETYNGRIPPEAWDRIAELL